MKKLIPFFVVLMIFTMALNTFAYTTGTFYSQRDPVWNFENNGRGYCWASCYAMLISNLKEETITPSDIAYINSLYNEDTAICYHTDIANAFDLEFEPAVSEDSPYFSEYHEFSGETVLNLASDEDAIKALKEALTLNPEGVMVRFQGNFVHTMLATHFDGNNIYFSDPAYMQNAVNLPFNKTYNGKNGYKLSDLSFIQAMKIRERNISVFIDYSYMDFESKPILKNGSVLVPMRVIFEELGAEVEWFSENQMIRATKDDSVMELAIGLDAMYKDYERIPLDVPAELIDGTTYVPVRAITEAFGYMVEWDSYSDSVYIYKPFGM